MRQASQRTATAGASPAPPEVRPSATTSEYGPARAADNAPPSVECLNGGAPNYVNGVASSSEKRWSSCEFARGTRWDDPHWVSTSPSWLTKGGGVDRQFGAQRPELAPGHLAARPSGEGAFDGSARARRVVTDRRRSCDFRECRKLCLARADRR